MTRAAGYVAQVLDFNQQPSNNQPSISTSLDTRIDPMNSRHQPVRSKDWMLYAGLVTVAVAARLLLQDLPNVSPVAALALFAGFYFRSWVLATSAPILVMLASDALIGSYDWSLMLLVYGALAIPVAMRGIVRRSFRNGVQLRSVFTVGACSLGSSAIFFLVTNFGAWLSFAHLYPRSWSGLLTCYAQGLPFYRDYTLIGDAIFASLLFGGYVLQSQLLTGTMHPATQSDSTSGR